MLIGRCVLPFLDFSGPSIGSWNRRLTSLALLCVALTLVHVPGHAQSAQVSAFDGCPRETAPASFKFVRPRAGSSGLPTNQGIVPGGFVELADGQPVVHGVDISKYQDGVDFRRVADCGGRFAYVRLSSGSVPENELEYRVHWANARSVGLMVGAYHFLKVPALQLPKRELNSRNESRLVADAAESARAQARLFIVRLDEMLNLDPKKDGTDPRSLGLPILPIALSAGATAKYQAGLDTAAIAVVGSVYRASICAWNAELRSVPRYRNVRTILFTYPYIYRDYEFDRSNCALKESLIWLGYATEDGSRKPEKSSRDSEVVEGICNRGGADRCVLHLYTSFGAFLDFDGRLAVDLNRFYGDEKAMAALLQQIQK